MGKHVFVRYFYYTFAIQNKYEMYTELKVLLERYRIRHRQIAEDCDCSPQLVSHVLNNTRRDKRGIIQLCIIAIKQAQKEEERQKAQIQELAACAA